MCLWVDTPIENMQGNDFTLLIVVPTIVFNYLGFPNHHLGTHRVVMKDSGHRKKNSGNEWEQGCAQHMHSKWSWYKTNVNKEHIKKYKSEWLIGIYWPAKRGRNYRM